jgi:hypothetical protein
MNADAKVDRLSPGSGRSAVSLNVPGRDAGAIGMILIRAGPAEYGNAAIAGVVDDLTADALHRTADVIQPVIQKRLRLVGIAGGNMARRSHHIDGENRYDVALRSRDAANGHRSPRIL